ncbi:MAG TPA: GNAT family N-acetyltransferase [Acidimicrobiales bacterium]
MRSPCRVRHADAHDAMKLRAIRLEALGDTPEAYGSTFEESAAWSERQWRRVAKTWNYYLGECDGVVRGMVSGGYNDQHPGTCWLYGMYVAPSARGSGLATELVEAVVAWARAQGARELFLHVTASVARARAFYHKVGFVETGETIAMDRDPSITLCTMVMQLD